MSALLVKVGGEGCFEEVDGDGGVLLGEGTLRLGDLLGNEWGGERRPASDATRIQEESKGPCMTFRVLRDGRSAHRPGNGSKRQVATSAGGRPTEVADRLRRALSGG